MNNRRDFAVVAAFVFATGLCLWGMPWHVDEPFFLAVARQILRDPLHPLSFAFNWYGRAVPMADLNNTPPLFCYLLAAALKLSGGGEFWTRACFFPFDLAAGWTLLALAGRFLKRPLLPTLIVLAGPGWALNLPHVMAERVMAGLALPALWLAVVAADEGGGGAWWGSAALAALALLTKYNALFVLPPALLYARSRGVAARKLAGWAAAALSGLAVYQAANWILGGGAARAAWLVTAASAGGAWSAPTHKARSMLAFTGGLSLVGAAWGFRLTPSRRVVLALGVATAVLFGPWFDLSPLVRPADRAAGFLMSWGTCVGAWALARGPRPRGAGVWAPWMLAVAALQIGYWCVLARFVVFLLPPLTFWLWERLEAERPRELSRLGGWGLAAALALSAALGTVDWTYASAQRNAVLEAAEGVPSGSRLWCAAHWGLQEYAVAAGGSELDWGRGGWDEIRPGDRVVTGRVNTNVIWPQRPMAARRSVLIVNSPIPLRLIRDRTGQGGFYSNVWGFLPWSYSNEPLDEIMLVDAL
jgi:hypothetical protein